MYGSGQDMDNFLAVLRRFEEISQAVDAVLFLSFSSVVVWGLYVFR